MAQNAQAMILRVEYAVAARPLVPKVGWSGENLKIEKHSSNGAKKSMCGDFYLRASFSSNLASKIAIFGHFWHLKYKSGQKY